MTNYPSHPYAPAQPQQRWKPGLLFWIVAAVLLLLLIPFAVAGGVGMVLFILGVVALLTGLYVFLFKRRSWVGLPHRRSGALVAVSGFVALILGAGVVGATADPRVDTDKAALVSPVQQQSATATPTPTPTPTATNPANSICSTAAATQKNNRQTLICTMGADQHLVWMTEADSKRVLAEKAAADKAVAEKAAAEKAAAEKAAAEKAAAEKAAADKAAADKAVADQAAQAAAAQAAAEQAARDAAARQAVPAPAAPAVPAPAAPSAYFGSCADAKAAGAAPLYSGQPGYRAALDRDRDGVACES
jgi:hypothetical protein